jgi:hypothetical protein
MNTTPVLTVSDDPPFVDRICNKIPQLGNQITDVSSATPASHG